MHLLTIWNCRFRDWYVESMDGVQHKLIRRSKPHNLLFVGELNRGTFSRKMVSSLEIYSLQLIHAVSSGPPCLLSCWNTCTWSSQWTECIPHGYSKGAGLYLCPDVWENGDRSESRDRLFQPGWYTSRRHWSTGTKSPIHARATYIIDQCSTV